MLAREALILHLREHEQLRFRQISKLLRLQGPDYVRTVYARACRHRRMMAANPSPQLLAEWRSLLRAALSTYFSQLFLDLPVEPPAERAA